MPIRIVLYILILKIMYNASTTKPYANFPETKVNQSGKALTFNLHAERETTTSASYAFLLEGSLSSSRCVNVCECSRASAFDWCSQTRPSVTWSQNRRKMRLSVWTSFDVCLPAHAPPHTQDTHLLDYPLVRLHFHGL